MAGLGRRTFAPGEVLTATNVMGYLQDQAVMTFAGTAARGSAIGTAVSEGMVSYLADTNDVEIYDGSSWRTPYGLTLIAKTSFTSVASVAIDNAFSSKYKNYKIIYKQDYSSGNGDLYVKGRTAGGDSNGGWYTGLIGASYTGSTPIYKQGTNTTYAIIGATVSAQSGRCFASIDVITPNVAASATQMGIQSFQPDNGLSGYSMELSGTSYTGFTFGVTSGTINGSLEVYGYRIA